jgi:hypothetical protein
VSLDSSEQTSLADGRSTNPETNGGKEKRKVTEIRADDLLNKEDFYRRQLMDHSVHEFHKQVLNRSKND